VCSRLTYLGPNGTVVTGRSMDWMVPVDTNLWILPAGLPHTGAAKDNSFEWTSVYGSVIAAGYDAATTDGLNEAGLVANLLYLGTAHYGERDSSRPGLTVSAWAQYALDMFATVDEAVAVMSAEAFQIVAPNLPGGFEPSLHLSLSDASGDSAILEHIEGHLVIHHSRDYQVMTNDPTFAEQRALVEQWKASGQNLPGSEDPADRFIRATHYLALVPPADDDVQPIADVLAIVRNVSVPFMVEPDPAHPNVAPTLWRTVADHRRRRYFFEGTNLPSIFWVDLDKVDLTVGAQTRRLVAENGPVRVGEVSAEFEDADVFVFMPEA
jgi:penicillin V acylase-like amidase (Ntn superfamily)